MEHQIVRTAAATRVRHFNLPNIEAARDPRHGYVLGRMYLDGTINEAQHAAGLRYGEDMARYFGLTGVPFPSARAQNLFAVRSTGGEDSDSKGEEARKARQRMTTLRAVLLACGDINTGRHVEHTVKLICVEDYDLPAHTKAWLKHGLNGLCRFYGGA